MTEQKHHKNIYRLDVTHWHILRAVYAIAGVFVIVSVLLALFVDERWLYFTGFVGGMLVAFALTGYCPMALFLDKINIPRE